MYVMQCPNLIKRPIFLEYEIPSRSRRSLFATRNGIWRCLFREIFIHLCNSPNGSSIGIALAVTCQAISPILPGRAVCWRLSKWMYSGGCLLSSSSWLSTNIRSVQARMSEIHVPIVPEKAAKRIWHRSQWGRWHIASVPTVF